MNNLLLEDIPDGFIERQLNDSRYISRYVMSLLSNIVREEIAPGVYEEEANSKNLISCNGSITARLKKDWGLNDVWNSIILPRFVRLNEICKTDKFISNNSEGHLVPTMPDELQKGFNKKRIDHRHHAMDAIVIACATRSHIQLLNNESAKSENRKLRHQLSRRLRRYEKVLVNGEVREVAREFIKPWPTFTQDVKVALESVIVSFKQNLRIINKATNVYISYRDERGELQLDRTGKPIKGTISQKSNPDWWAVRKPLHKDTVFAKVLLKKTKSVRLCVALQNPDAIVGKELRDEIKRLIRLGYDEKRIRQHFSDGENKDIWAEFNPTKLQVYYFTDDTFAVRKGLDESFDAKKIEAITDTGIQKILLKHLAENSGDPRAAFDPDGVERMNADIERLNNGRKHQPIYKVRWYESGSKFAVGDVGNKNSKFVEAAKGTNLYFAIYVDAYGKRTFETIPLNDVIDRLKKMMSPVPEMNCDGNKLLFHLSPNDLVYVPDIIEIKLGEVVDLDKTKIYKMVSSSGAQCCFINERVASTIVNKVEFSPLNKMERAITGEMIKDVCIPIKVDRLGNVIYIGTEFLPKSGSDE
jgi:CRISPR-associated endonuclease Csn1